MNFNEICDLLENIFVLVITVIEFRANSSVYSLPCFDHCVYRYIYVGPLQVRIGIPFIHILGMEKVMYKYGVDLMFWAHEHSYERLWPVYDRKVRTILDYPTFLLNYIVTWNVLCQKIFKSDTTDLSIVKS